jgi:hypothetical protein
VIAGRLDKARTRGCDAVEPDNVDGYANSNGMGLTKANQLNVNRWLADRKLNKHCSKVSHDTLLKSL